MHAAVNILRSFFLATLLGAVKVRCTCYLPPTMVGEPAEHLVDALENVTCPVITGINNLITYGELSTIIPTSKAIVSTFDATTSYIKASAPITSSPPGTPYWEVPLLNLPYQFSLWSAQLLKHKTAILNNQDIISSLPQGLLDQKAAASTFINAVVGMIHVSQKADARKTLAPVIIELDCVIRAFKPGSSVTTCPGYISASAEAAATAGTGSGSGSMSMSMSTTSSMGSTTASVPSSGTAMMASTSTHSGAAAATAVSDMSTGAMLFGFMLGGGVLPFDWD